MAIGIIMGFIMGFIMGYACCMEQNNQIIRMKKKRPPPFISALCSESKTSSYLAMSTKVEHSVAAVVGPITSPTFVSSGIVNVSDDYTVGAGVGVVRVNGYVPISVVLPTASSNAGRFITVVNVGTGGVVLSGYGGTETVCGMAQLVLVEQNDSLTLVCDGGSGWDAVGADVDRLQRWTNFCSLFRFSPALTTKQQSPNASTPVLYYNRMKLPNQLSSLKYRVETLTTNGTCGILYSSGFLLPNGKLLFFTSPTTNTLIIFDPQAKSFNTITTGTTSTQSLPWQSACLCPNGYVCLVPYNSGIVGLLKPPYTTTSDFVSGPAHNLPGSNVYKGGVLTKDGSNNWVVVMTPNSSTVTKVGLYYPDMTGSGGIGTFATCPTTGAAGLMGGIIAPNGNVIMGSGGSSTFYTYYPSSNAFTSSSLGQWYCMNGASTLTGHILYAFGTYSKLYDAVTNTQTTGPTLTQGSVYSAPLTLPNGHILMIGTGVVEIFDPVENSTVSLPITGPSSGTPGACLLPDGRILFHNYTNTVYVLYTNMQMPMALAQNGIFNRGL